MSKKKLNVINNIGENVECLLKTKLYTKVLSLVTIVILFLQFSGVVSSVHSSNYRSVTQVGSSLKLSASS